MPPKKKATAPAPFDLSQFREAKSYVWREIERDDGSVLSVKLLRLNMREAEAIPYTNDTEMAEIHAAIAPYIVEWDFKAENMATGKVVDVPPPAEVGGEVLELMESSAGITIAAWLKLPNVMMKATEKKDSTPSGSAATHTSKSDEG